MSPFRTHVLVAAGGSAALLLGALYFQYVVGLAPCHLCILQRWPHLAAIAIGVMALALGQRALAWLGAAAAFTTSAIGVYHTGVEQKWWEGPSTCTSSNPASLSADEFFDKIIGAPLIRCDDIPWDLFGLSMATYNAIFAFLLALVWIRAATLPRT